MEELSRTFVETFKTELVSGIIKRGTARSRKDREGHEVDSVKYEVRKENDRNGVIIITTLYVGDVVVFERKHWTTYGSEVEVEAAQVRTIRDMIHELPYVYKAVRVHLDKSKNRTLAEKALEGLALLKSVFNELGTR